MKKKICMLVLTVILSLLCVRVNAQELDCTTTLRYGSTGENVKVLQALLNEKAGCNLSVDGVYGSNTKNCVVSYQQNNNLSADGVVGKNTCNMLNGTSEIIRTYQATNTTRGIVVANEANVRTGASTSYSKIGTLKLGTVVKIVDTVNGWYKIQGSNNTYGYISSSLVAQNCILLDISQQRLYVFENGQKSWSTRVVTGNQGNHDTPVGSYTLNPANFQRQTYLRGTNDNGTKYASYVDYWMPFILNRGIGFHDASWRTYDQFQTLTYKGNGSHGCVNMMHDAAEKLYNSITTTTNVVVRN